MSRAAVRLAVVALSLTALPSLVAVARAQETPVPAELGPILERAGRYALEYEEQFQNIAAEEEYTQWTRTEDGHATLPRP